MRRPLVLPLLVLMLLGGGPAAGEPPAGDARAEEALLSWPDAESVAREARSYTEPLPAVTFARRPGKGIDEKALRDAVVMIKNRGGHGSGFLVAKRGYVLTSWHVVRGGKEVDVIWHGRPLPARVLRANPERDVALIEFRAMRRATPLPLPRLAPAVGSAVHVIGTPLGARRFTVTSGTLSDRRPLRGQPAYQLDAGIDPGASGGPVLNERGEVIGLAVASRLERAGLPDQTQIIPIEDALLRLGLSPESKTAR